MQNNCESCVTIVFANNGGRARSRRRARRSAPAVATMRNETRLDFVHETLNDVPAIGDIVEIFWDGHMAWFRAEVIDNDVSEKKIFVRYLEDGVEECCIEWG